MGILGLEQLLSFCHGEAPEIPQFIHGIHTPAVSMNGGLPYRENHSEPTPELGGGVRTFPHKPEGQGGTTSAWGREVAAVWRLHVTVWENAHLGLFLWTPMGQGAQGPPSPRGRGSQWTWRFLSQGRAVCPGQAASSLELQFPHLRGRPLDQPAGPSPSRVLSSVKRSSRCPAVQSETYWLVVPPDPLSLLQAVCTQSRRA